MIQRSNPLSICAGPNYALVELAERRIHIRKPFASEAAELLRWTFDTEKLAQVEIKERLEAVEGGDPSQQWAILRDSNQYIEALRGRLIGSVWAHETYELECVNSDHSTPEAFGMSVYRELHEANWSAEEIDALHSAVVEMLLKLGSQRYNARKVNHILNFGEALEVPKPSCIATLGSNTSETLAV